MQDLREDAEIKFLVGKLYMLSERAADDNHELFMNDPDAQAFAKAYSLALDYKKHGNPIFLPQHLHGRIPAKLHKYLQI